MSETAALSWGVPQGAVLGPILLVFHAFHINVMLMTSNFMSLKLDKTDELIVLSDDIGLNILQPNADKTWVLITASDSVV